MPPHDRVKDSGIGLRFKAYPAYRDSGTEWLGRVPAHWEVKRLKFSARLNPPASEAHSLSRTTEVSFVPMEAVGEYGGLDVTRTIPLADVGPGYTYFRDGDVVVAKITPCFENGKGALAAGLTAGIAFGTTELHSLRPTEALDGRFLFYLTLSHPLRRLGEAEMYGAGGQKRVPGSFFENFRQPLPPIAEQRAIADFLDRETAKIDELVEKKEQLISVLDQTRLALISRMVTGLTNRSLSNASAPWLGKIPTHWTEKRLKFLLSEPLQYGASEPAELTDQDLPRFIRITDIGNDGKLRDETFRSIAEDVAAPYLLRHGDVLLARSGATVGKSCRYDTTWGRAAHAGYLIRARLDSGQCDSRFFTYFTQARPYWDWLRATLIQATIQNLSAERYANLVVPLPPLTEQHTIVEELDTKTAKLTALREKATEGITWVRDLRTSLISAAVTGQIDVREAT